MKINEIISPDDRYPEFLIMKKNFITIFPFFDIEKFYGSFEDKLNKMKCLINFMFHNYSIRATAKSMELPDHYFYNAIQRDDYFRQCIDRLKSLRLQVAEDILFETLENTQNDILKIDIAKFILERKGGWIKESKTDITTNGRTLGDLKVIEINTPEEK